VAVSFAKWPIVISVFVNQGDAMLDITPLKETSVAEVGFDGD
jgi:hypothetical protein